MGLEIEEHEGQETQSVNNGHLSNQQSSDLGEMENKMKCNLQICIMSYQSRDIINHHH